MTTACFGTVFLTYSLVALKEEIITTAIHKDFDLTKLVRNCKDGFELEDILNKVIQKKFDIHEKYIHFFGDGGLIVGIMIEHDDTVRDLQILVKRAETIKYILENLFDTDDEPRVKFLPF